MTDTTLSKDEIAPRDGRCRVTRPERIDIGSDILIRNDVLAKAEGVSVRSLDSGDARGDPFTFIGGIKYRPLRGHQEYRANQIRVLGQPPKRRRA